MPKIDTYLKKIPLDLSLLLRGIGSELRFRAALLLRKEGDLSLSEISRSTGTKVGTVLPHIKKLEIGGVVQNYLQKKEGTSEYSFFSLTPFGERMANSLASSYQKKTEFRTPTAFDDPLPEPFASLLRGISNKFRFALILLLMDKGSQSFSDLVRMTARKKSSVAYHLECLRRGGIVKGYLEEVQGTRDYSFYRLGSLGDAVISSLLRSYNGYYKEIRVFFKM